jgi:hypothetical protein
MEINGLPAHGLVIHSAVVLGPLAAVFALAYALVPRWRERARVPMVVLAVVAGLCVVAAYLTGNDLLDHHPQLGQIPAVQTHEDRAVYALWLTIAFAVVAVAAALLHRRTGAVRVALSALLAVSAVSVLVSVVLTGDAGAQAVWGGIG